jgi:hypothetical protein
MSPPEVGALKIATSVLLFRFDFFRDWEDAVPVIRCRRFAKLAFVTCALICFSVGWDRVEAPVVFKKVNSAESILEFVAPFR